jgi:hypothetical protein
MSRLPTSAARGVQTALIALLRRSATSNSVPKPNSYHGKPRRIAMPNTPLGPTDARHIPAGGLVMPIEITCRPPAERDSGVLG